MDDSLAGDVNVARNEKAAGDVAEMNPARTTGCGESRENEVNTRRELRKKISSIKEIMTMRNRAKQVLCLVLALAMFAAMGITAMASEYVITIQNPHVGETYYFYKIFDATYNGTSVAYTISETSAWYDIIANRADSPFTLTETGNNTGVYNVSSGSATSDDLAKWFHALAEDSTVTLPTADGEYTPADTDVQSDYFGGSTLIDYVTYDVGSSGYYFITTTTGSVVSLTTTAPTATTRDKNLVPTPTKTVEEDSTGTYGDSNTAAVGDIVPFRITIDSFYEATKLSLTDELGTGLAFVEFTSITLDGATLTQAATVGTFADASEDYYIESGGTNGADGFVIVFNTSSTLIAAAVQNSTITVEYTAVVTEDAVTVDAATNSAYVNYGENSTSTIDETTTRTVDFVLSKTDATGTNKLDGAKFQLYDENGDLLYFTITAVDSSGYPTEYVLSTATTEYIQTAGEYTVNDITSTLVAGNITVKGLDAGDYTLTETEAPAGYTKLTYDLFLTLYLDSSNTDMVTWTRNGTGSTYGGTNNVVSVSNSTGSEIPATGGIGTTIFYIVGALLMVGAAVVLITRRRMRSNEQ